MTNRETLHNYLKVEMLEDKNLHNNYMNHIDDAIKNYTAICILECNHNPKAEINFINNELDARKKKLEDALNSDYDVPLNVLYSFHVRVVALEYIKNRYIYFSPLEILEKKG